MRKEEIKQKLRKAVKWTPYISDIKSAAISGSYVDGGASEQGDIDVLIDFEPRAVIGFFALSDIKSHLEVFLQKMVDLVTPQGISKYFREEVLEHSEYVYKK